MCVCSRTQRRAGTARRGGQQTPPLFLLFFSWRSREPPPPFAKQLFWGAVRVFFCTHARLPLARTHAQHNSARLCARAKPLFLFLFRGGGDGDDDDGEGAVYIAQRKHRASADLYPSLAPSKTFKVPPLSILCVKRPRRTDAQRKGRKNEITKYLVAAGRVFLVCGKARGEENGAGSSKASRLYARRHAQACARRLPLALRGAKVAASQEAALKREQVECVCWNVAAGGREVAGRERHIQRGCAHCETPSLAVFSDQIAA